MLNMGQGTISFSDSHGSRRSFVSMSRSSLRVLYFLMLLLAVDVVEARIGGGQTYSGGSSSKGSSSGRSSSSGGYSRSNSSHGSRSYSAPSYPTSRGSSGSQGKKWGEM